MDVLTGLKNQGGRSVHHTQSTSPTTQETLPVSPKTRMLTLLIFGKIRIYSEYLELLDLAVIRKYSKIFGNARFRMSGKP